MEQRQDDRDDEAARNRALMPHTAAIVAAYRAAFGSDAVVLRWVREGEHERGRKRFAPADW